MDDIARGASSMQLDCDVISLMGRRVSTATVLTSMRRRKKKSVRGGQGSDGESEQYSLLTLPPNVEERVSWSESLMRVLLVVCVRVWSE